MFLQLSQAFVLIHLMNVGLEQDKKGDTGPIQDSSWERLHPPGWERWSKKTQTKFKESILKAEKELGNPPDWARSLLSRSRNAGFDLQPSLELVKACLDADLGEKRSTLIVKTAAIHAGRSTADHSSLAHWIVQRLKEVSEDEIRKEVERLDQVPWRVAFRKNDSVEDPDAKKVQAAVRNRWLGGKTVEVISTDQLYNNMAKYDQHRILTVDIQKAYGEFYINIRKGEIKKHGNDHDEYPFGKIFQSRATKIDELIEDIEQSP